MHHQWIYGMIISYVLFGIENEDWSIYCSFTEKFKRIPLHFVYKEKSLFWCTLIILYHSKDIEIVWYDVPWKINKTLRGDNTHRNKQNLSRMQSRNAMKNLEIWSMKH